MNKLIHRFPRIGQRIVKSAFAVGLCVFLYYLLGYEDIPFFLVISALQGMQPYRKGAGEAVLKNMQGTLIGAGCAFAIVLLQYFVLDPYDVHYVFYCLLISLGVLITLYTAVVLHSAGNAQFAAVVFICIVSVHIGNENPYMYVVRRLVETLLGFGVGVFINALHLPRHKDRDTLFVVSLDHVLHSEFSQLPAYSIVELNRLLDDGIKLSVITNHTASSFQEIASELRFNLPVILMEGALLYDPASNSYPAKTELSYDEAERIGGLLRYMDLNVLTTALVDDTPLTFYDTSREKFSELFEKLRRSPYRNYIKKPLPEGMPVICLTAIDDSEKIQNALHVLEDAGFSKEYKLSCYESTYQQGLSYIRIFSKDADRHKMLDKLKLISGNPISKTYGNNSSYDVYVRTAEGESIIKALRRDYEPIRWMKKKK